MITTVPIERTGLSLHQRIAQAAMERLRQVPYPSIRGVSCECNEQGVVFLRGQLPSFYHKQLAQEAVAKVAGIVRVINEIEVEFAVG